MSPALSPQAVPDVMQSTSLFNVWNIDNYLIGKSLNSEINAQDKYFFQENVPWIGYNMFWRVCLYGLKSEVGCSSRFAASFNYASSVATGSPCLRCLNIKYKIRLRRRRRYKFLITYWFGVHQFRQSLWYWIQISINCYLSWFCTCFGFLDIAFLPQSLLFCQFLVLLYTTQWIVEKTAE